MSATLQDLDSADILNEARDKIGTPTIQCVDPFSLRMILANNAVSIIIGNLSTLAFKDVQPLLSEHESTHFPDLSLVTEGFLIE